ncbi:MAG TPA: adenylosuccinate synthase [Thermoanaerobaculia bacterium]|nr:adenylosuccinate synthase [Thermoanaerobaculia bacterium]
MANVIIVGMQWGDEGKGKIVDLLCPAFDGVVRYQGGHNAGHTVRFGERHFSLQLIPSGILHKEMLCVLANGMVVAPDALLSELARLYESGVRFDGRLFVSSRAHVLLPYHAELDRAREEARGAGRIGTTARGIGPAYESKASRAGLRVCDLVAPDLEDRLRVQLNRIQTELDALAPGGPPLALPAAYADQCRGWAEKLKPCLADTEQLLNGWIAAGKSLLFEGAQGTLLDLDHGTYPYVTSSSSTAGGALTGTGVPPTRIAGVLGVLKAYTTRVGGGPMVGELDGPVGEFLRRRGNEFGTVTGRPRRCGWLDTVVARYARMVNGVDAIALTKLDVLDDFEEIPVCIGYRVGGAVIRELPAERHVLERAEPVLRTLKGWKEKTVGILDYADLPQAARDYVDFLEQEVGAPVGLVSTGPRREETIVREQPALARLTAGRLGRVVAQRQDA